MQRSFESETIKSGEDSKIVASVDLVGLYGDSASRKSGNENFSRQQIENNGHLQFNFDNFYGSFAPGNDLASSKQSAFVNSDSQALKESKESLSLDAALLIASPTEQAAFKNNMQLFEQRQKNGEIPAQQVTNTYQALDRLIGSPDGAIAGKDRLLMAQNFMHLAAHPEQSDQGLYHTCNVTALQEKLLTRYPAKAAEAMTEGALTGAYTAPDGKHIQLDLASMQPIAGFAGEADATPVDGARSYATQVLNHILVNEITQRVTDEHNTMLYTQRHERSETDRGERLLSMRDGSEMTFGDTDVAIRAPGLTGIDIAAAIKRHTGEDNVYLARDSDALKDGRLAINTPEELEKAVAEAKRQNRTPLLVEVNGADPLFKGGFASGAHAEHVLSVRDYDASTRTLSISNQWGKDADIKSDVNSFFATMINAQKAKKSPVV